MVCSWGHMQFQFEGPQAPTQSTSEDATCRKYSAWLPVLIIDLTPTHSHPCSQQPAAGPAAFLSRDKCVCFFLRGSAAARVLARSSCGCSASASPRLPFQGSESPASGRRRRRRESPQTCAVHRDHAPPRDHRHGLRLTGLRLTSGVLSRFYLLGPQAAETILHPQTKTSLFLRQHVDDTSPFCKLL